MYLPPFEVTILGTSSAIPAFKRFPSSQLVHLNGSYVLIDCGEGTQMQLRKYKLPFSRIETLLVSHVHGDHIFGIPGFLTSLSLLQREKPLTIVCPINLKKLLDVVIKESASKISYPINYICINPHQKELVFCTDKYKVFAFPLKHRVPTFGYLIEEQERDRKILLSEVEKFKIPIHQMNRLKKGMDAEDENGNIVSNKLLTSAPTPTRKYAYCSDTAKEPTICNYIRNADMLYHEATFMKEHQKLADSTMHSTSIDAAETAKSSNVKKLLIGHYSGRYEKLDILLKEAQEIFENTFLSKEGETFKI